ncbi:homeobox protein cut isoform X3 [Hermetia illucens]|uniref:homeobox protein cut isoform X3 n=1 Tax=Hermetia illucens TaxID=343691 RepID=UPI0018CC3127|nr:homeobox protein cut isoform X3 [Hermetia illucens]
MPSNLRQFVRMQPTIPQTQTTVTADMDLPAVQSMDWLFKKERIYLLAQFWQQRATLAEKEVNTLKEQLYGSTPTTSVSPLSPTTSSSASSNNSTTSTIPVNTTVTASAILAAVSPTSAVSGATATTIPNKHTLNNNNINSNSNSSTKLNSFTITQQNGLPSPASTPPASSCGSAAVTPTGTPTTAAASKEEIASLAANCIGSLTNKLLNFTNSGKMDDGNSMTSLTSMTADIKLEEQLHKDNNNSSSCSNNNNSNSNNTNNSNSSANNNLIRSSTPIDKNLSTDCPSNLSNVNNSGNNNSSSSNSGNNNASGNNSSSSSGKSSLSSSTSNSSTTATTSIATSLSLAAPTTTTGLVTDELAAKDKEIKALIDEVTRLTALQETHVVQIQRLEERLELNRQHITRLEAQLQQSQREQSGLTSGGSASSVQPLNLVDESIVKKENSSIIPSLDISSPAVAAAAAAAASVAQDAKQFQELLLERTKALAAAQSEALKSSACSEDANSSGGGLNNCHQDIDKASSHHETSSTASTPNLQDTRSTDEHMNGSCGPGGLGSMSMQQMMKNQAEDNNNSLGPLPHVPAGFLPGLPFQFQERGHFRFAEDLQLPPGSMAGRLGDSLIPKSDPMEAKLQEMLRYNMDKYANQNLDTLHISRRIRELLSVHNIGQRIFAKYILGLSQGTVSELLSKPKPWDKLTEKGRDSYRKMHAWGCDDNAVLLLKSLIPKKDSGMPQYGRPDEGMSDDRIAHILSEASNLMKTPQGHSQASHLQQQQVQQAQQQQQQQAAAAAQHFQQAAAAAAAAAAVQQQQHAQQQSQQQPLHQNSVGQEDSHSNEDSKSPPNQSTSPFFKDSMQRRMKKYDNDDISQDKVARIYQEELAKLMTRGPRDAFQSFLFPHFFSGGMPPAAANANQPQMPDENIRMALEAYHRELAKLQQTGGALPNFPNLPGLLALQQQALNGAQDLTCKKDKSMKVNGQQNSFSMETADQNTKDSTSASDEALRHSSAFSLVRPKQEPGTPAPTTTAATTPSTAPSPLSNSILPPAMTPSDDFSSSASPLQRMASITNSLITQPPVTPHHNTPQRPMKAVLPPITQQQFDMFNNLNTEDIVRRVKEALSQYSISQRLFGESVLGLSQGSVSDLLARPKPWHMLTQKGREPFIRMKMFLEDENAVHKLVASQYKIAPEKLMRTGNYSGSPQIPAGINPKMVPMQKMMNEMKMQDAPQHLMQLQASAMAHIPTSQHQGMLLTPPGLPPHHAISLPSHNDKKQMMMPSVHSPQQNNAMRGMHQHMSPTVYEMAALTHDLDTQVITTKIKEALLANNIGQKIFGEAVLGLSQGSVSELLSKPKPWHMLSIKGREPFIRMQLWLSDANNVERLQALKIERREASKRRRSTGPGTQDNSSDTSSNDTADFYTGSPGPGSVGSGAGVPPNKKQRVLFSEEQKEALRLAFALDPYPNVATIEFLASELGLATRTITNWFHNHRMRLKQQVPHGTPSEPVPSRENQSATPFDPVQFRILLNQRLMELQKERMGLSGVPIPYPPYFTTNPNLAALIGRGLLPGNEPSLAALNNAFKEQMSGLDLTMNALKRERNDDFEDDGEEESHLSDAESLDGSDVKSENLKETPSSSSRLSGGSMVQSRTSRRKPAAPQWVNPDWQDGAGGPPPPGPITEPEVIINGVCVMQNQAADYSRKAGSEETVRVEPTDVQDHHRSFDDDAEEDCASDADDDEGRRSQMSNKHSEPEIVNENDENDLADEKNEDCESVVEDDTPSGGRSGGNKNGDSKAEEIDDDDEEEGDSGWHY